MQEEFERKTVHLAVETTKLSARAAVKALSMYLQYQKQVKARKAVKAAKPMGKQTVKELIGQGKGVSSVPIADTGLKDFEKTAKRYGVDFAVVKDKTVSPPKYTIFFKAQDADAIADVVKVYSSKMMQRKTVKKPSLLANLKRFKELVASMPRKVAEKMKEHTR